MYGILLLHLSTSLGCFCPRTFLSNNRLVMLPHFGYIYQTRDNQQECSKLSNWSSFRCLLLHPNDDVIPPVARGFPSQRPMTQSFDVFFDLCLNKHLSKKSRRWWCETSLRSLLGFVRTRVLMSRSRLNNGATHGGWHFDIHRDFDTRGR